MEEVISTGYGLYPLTSILINWYNFIKIALVIMNKHTFFHLHQKIMNFITCPRLNLFSLSNFSTLKFAFDTFTSIVEVENMYEDQTWAIHKWKHILNQGQIPINVTRSLDINFLGDGCAEVHKQTWKLIQKKEKWRRRALY